MRLILTGVHSAPFQRRYKTSMAEFRINKHYAEKYNKFREKEELQMLKDKYGKCENSGSSSSSESEDEDGEELNPKLEKDWLRTLSALKSKDPKIYEKDFKFFDRNQDQTVKSKQKRLKPMFIKDYDRKIILEKDGTISSDEETPEIPFKKGHNYYEEQEEIRKSFHSNQQLSDEEESSELLQKRKKSKEAEAKDEEEYLEWLKGRKFELESDQNVGIELKSLNDYWKNPKLDEGEKFLRDFILNKRYKDSDEDWIPTYKEIVSDEDNYDEEEDLLQKQDEFERKYNFRYEEPDQDFIKNYPRVIGDSLRKKESKRSDKRQEIKERKKKEKEKKKEEIKQLKNLKKKEIQAKLEKLREITGNKTLGISEEDLNDDFDPKKHDEMMQKYFDSEYYGQDEGEQKPTFSDEEIEVENWDNWTGTDNNNVNEQEWSQSIDAEDPNFVMDCDYDAEVDQERKKQKKQKKSKFSKALNKTKPVFDPQEKTFEEYFDEYYKLDYEDVIGDMPTRFRYRKVPENDFGLNVDEILTCKDKELNAWVSLKKMTQYRTKEEEETDKKIFKVKSKNVRKKQNILHSLAEQEENNLKKESEKVDQGNSSISSKKKKRKKKVGGQHEKNKPMKDENNVNEKDSPPPKKTKLNSSDKYASNQTKTLNSQGELSKKEKKKQHKTEGLSQDNSKRKDKNKSKKKKFGKPIISDERLKAYGINPKKYKYMKFKKHSELIQN